MEDLKKEGIISQSGSGEQNPTAQLQSIVAEFNEKFKGWHEEFGMNVEFGWGYTPGKNGVGVKQIELQKIDMPIYRKPVPTAAQFMEKVKENTNVQGDLATKL